MEPFGLSLSRPSVQGRVDGPRLKDGCIHRKISHPAGEKRRKSEEKRRNLDLGSATINE
jgi:hypothetical protein